VNEPDVPPVPEPGEADSALEEARRRERRRTRWVVASSSALTLLVVAAVVVLAGQSEQPKAVAPPPGARALDQGDLRETAWPDPGCAPDPAHPPKIVFDLPPEGLDYGPVKQGEKLERDVTFRNEGTGVLCIRNVHTPCGCVKAHLVEDTQRFDPGASGTIHVVLDSTGRVGEQHKSVIVYTNDIANPAPSFQVHAVVSQGVIVSPAWLDLGRAIPGEAASGEVTLHSEEGKDDWKITDVVGSKDLEPGSVHYTWKVAPVTDPKGRTYRLTITHPGRDQTGTFQDTILVRTTNPEKPEVTIPLRLLVIPQLLVRPPRAILGFVHQGTSNPTRVQVVPGAKSVTFQVTKAEVLPAIGDEMPADGLPFAARAYRDDDGAWWVEVTYDGKDRAEGIAKALLVIHTDLEALPELRVPVTAHVERGG
jgi:Protein of unknown function (DUF1573)